jgi:hypothetical protein
VLEFGRIVKKSIEKQNMLAWQYNAIGVSDAITMGAEGMCPHVGPCHPLGSALRVGWLAGWLQKTARLGLW